MPDELDRLQKELYAKDEPEEITMRRKELVSLGHRSLAGVSSGVKGVVKPLANVAQERVRRRRRQLRWLAVVIGVLVVFGAAVAATAAWRASRQVKDADIALAVAGASDVTAGDEVTYTIAFQNNSRVAWQNVEVVVALPEGFRAIDRPDEREFTHQVGTLAAGEANEMVVRGRLIGEEGAVAVTQAELTLTPENFPSGRFSKTAVAITRIAAMPIDVSIDLPSNAGAGERVRGVIHVRNSGHQALTGAVLRIAPDAGVELAVEDPEFSDGFDVTKGEWALESVGTLSELTRTAVFFVQGQAGEKRHITVQVGVQEGEKVFIQREVIHVLALSASELQVEQIYNGSNEPLVVFPESQVEARVSYANTGTGGLRNAVVAVQFEGGGFDARALELKQGAYDGATRRITWTAASVPELALLEPGESGTLEFSFEILPAADFPKTDKNFALVSNASVDSQDLPTPAGQEKRVISDRMVMSVATQLTLEASAFYDDGRLGIQSTGPLPPKVGQTTTYTVRLRAGSALNDVGEVKIVAGLPDGVRYADKKVVSKGSVQFDDRSREVIWTLPLLEGGVGRVRPAEELYFQVSVTPGANVEGRVLPLLGKLTGEGTDVFVDQLVTAGVADLPTTQTASAGRGQVVP